MNPQSRTGRKLLSIVVPAFNEAANLGPLYERAEEALARIDLDWEIVFVDDGSTDDTREVLQNLHAQNNRVKALFLSRNFGQGPALTAGIEAARGDVVAILDADGQDPPELLPEMLARWREGFEIVGGRRIRRSDDPLGRRVAAFGFYRVMNAMVGWDFPFDTGEFRLIDRAVADVFLRCPQRHRLVRTLTSWAGFRQTTVDYEHGRRHSGATKYSWRASTRLAITSITSFSMMPLRVAGIFGVFLSLFAGAASIYLLIRLGLGYGDGWLPLAVAGLWFLGGLQCVFIGILGEYLGRTYLETQHRPIYVIRDSLGIGIARSS
ncbi:MAG: glycosyl transferase [Candidatus Hydrogenedentota bacterium]